jgi:hypothetical protein
MDVFVNVEIAWRAAHINMDPNSDSHSFIIQVDLTIKDATNVDKLCQMYEGWTPWT